MQIVFRGNLAGPDQEFHISPGGNSHLNPLPIFFSSA